MRITKCDICKKTIHKDSETISMAHSSERMFASFEFCSTCSKPIIKMLENKKLINKKVEKLEKKFA